jgi:hypothetical protein
MIIHTHTIKILLKKKKEYEYIYHKTLLEIFYFSIDQYQGNRLQ